MPMSDVVLLDEYARTRSKLPQQSWPIGTWAGQSCRVATVCDPREPRHNQRLTPAAFER